MRNLFLAMIISMVSFPVNAELMDAETGARILQNGRVLVIENYSDSVEGETVYSSNDVWVIHEEKLYHCKLNLEIEKGGEEGKTSFSCRDSTTPMPMN